MDNQQLISRIEALEKWKAEKERQQIKLPIDNVSIAVLQNYFMRITGEFSYIDNGVSGNSSTTYIGSQGDQIFELNKTSLFLYTADATSDILTVANGSFITDRLVFVATETTAPGGLTTYDSYYTVNVTNNGTSFKLSLTSMGAAINITSSGTGQQFISYVTT